MVKIETRGLQLRKAFKEHISINQREYIIVLLMFAVGIFLGVMFINNCKTTQKDEITVYINNYISNAKGDNSICTIHALKDSIKDNILLAIGLWFAGTTIIGIPIVFGIVLFRGFCLGYTISACVYTLGISKGMVFIAISMLLQNILFIPALLALCVSGIKLYKSIIKDRRKENIKIEVIRHTIFSVFMLIVLIISAIIKINISGELIQNLIKYF